MVEKADYAEELLLEFVLSWRRAQIVDKARL